MPAVSACAIKTASPVSSSAMAKLPVICVLLSSVAAPVEVPVIVAMPLTPVIVTVTSCESVLSAEVAVKLSVKVAPLIKA